MRATGGRLGWQLVGMPVLELTTVGRRTGRRRTVILTSPLQEDEALVIVASRGGDDRDPEWFLNLLANPRVDVARRGGRSSPMVARVATQEERDRMWPLIVARYAGYAGYQQRTKRNIPVVILAPAV